MAVRIRAASLRDVPELEGVVGQHWKVNIDHLKELENPEAVLLVAEDWGASKDSREVVGTALMWLTKWNKTGYLVELAVHKDHQRRGIGAKLVRALAQRARRQGLRSIIVETQPYIREGIDFYLRTGFRMCGYNDRYYTNAPKTSRDIALFFSLDL